MSTGTRCGLEPTPNTRPDLRSCAVPEVLRRPPQRNLFSIKVVKW